MPSPVYNKSKIIQNQYFFGQERPDSDNMKGMHNISRPGTRTCCDQLKFINF